jgi:hypothetical protein
MISCKQFKDYITDNLNENEKKTFELHMKNCERCQKAFKSEMLIIEAFDAVPKIKAPHGFAAEVLSEVYFVQKKSFAWAVYTVCVLFLVFLTGFLTNFSSDVVFAKTTAFFEITNGLGHSLYLAVNNISSVLYNNIPTSSLLTGILLTTVFFITGYALLKTAFVTNNTKKR